MVVYLLTFPTRILLCYHENILNKTSWHLVKMYQVGCVKALTFITTKREPKLHLIDNNFSIFILKVSEEGYDVFKVRIVGAKNLAKKDIFGLRLVFIQSQITFYHWNTRFYRKSCTVITMTNY